MKKLIGLIIAAILLNGCVYYNTFFNAKKYFNEAQEMELQDTGRPKSGAIQSYNKTIKKCGVILTEYKDTKWADDALFLLAQCLYYKGTSYTQSIEKFEDLILFYPESEYVPEAKIYIARAHYGFNKKAEALDLLREFINDETYTEHHPLALMTLANFQLDEKDLLEAEFYFNQIIAKYPKSDEYEEAYYSLGKTHFLGKDYAKSNEVFNGLLKSRLPKKIKLNSRYSIALNHLFLEDYTKAYKISKKLVTDEYRESEISKIQMIVARSEIGLGKYEDATLLLENIMDDNKKSALSAEAAFHLGEMYLNDLQDYEKAIEYYNKVKTEYSRSLYIENALSKSAVASQIIQYNDPNTEIEANELVNEQLKLAEYYIEVLSLPDSALIVYDNIIKAEDILTIKLDSLNFKIIELEKMRPVVDSLETAVRDSMLVNTLQNDSLFTEIQIDSLNLDTTFVSPPLVADSLAKDSLTNVKEITLGDSVSAIKEKIGALDKEGLSQPKADDSNEEIAETEISEKSIIDSVKAEAVNDSIETVSVVDTLQLKLERYVFERDKTATNIGLYQEEIIPFVHFIKLWVFKNIYQDSVRVDATFNILQTNYANHKYTRAAGQYLAGEEVDFSSPELIEETQDYKLAVIDFETNADTTAVRLQPIAENLKHAFNIQANYALGYLNYFELADSTNAKTYLNYVLDQDADNIYTSNIDIFYDGEKFISYDRLPYLDVLDQKAAEKREREEEEARLAAEALEAETLAISDSLGLSDSLEVSKDEFDKKNREDKVKETRDASILKRSGIKIPPQYKDEPHIVTAEIEIFASARTGKIRIVKPELDENDEYAKFLITLLRSWEYQPALKDGVAIGSKSLFDIDFDNE